MYIVIVSIFTKPEHLGQFKAATLDNATNTRREPGNVRFDVIEHESEPGRFTLYEVYHTKEDFALHQQTEHYIRWRDSVADWMAQARSSVKGTPVFFDDAVSS